MKTEVQKYAMTFMKKIDKCNLVMSGKTFSFVGEKGAWVIKRQCVDFPCQMIFQLSSCFLQDCFHPPRSFLFCCVWPSVFTLRVEEGAKTCAVSDGLSQHGIFGAFTSTKKNDTALTNVYLEPLSLIKVWWGFSLPNVSELSSRTDTAQALQGTWWS